MTPREVVEYAAEREAKIVDIRFVDLFGIWHHFSMPVSCFTEETFDEGIGFDGSSIRGFQKINESDMLLVPDPDTAFMDPFTEEPTMVIVCNIEDPITRESYSRDPRYVAKKAEGFLKQSGLADVAYFGPEAEFFIFGDIRYETTPYSSTYVIDSDEGAWNSGRDEKPNLGYKVRYKGGYFPVPPTDSLQDLRTKMLLTLIESGVESEIQHHEVATAGQSELDIKYGPLLQTADNLMKYKYIVRNVAFQHGYTVTFMPKPLFGDNGSGMHCHQSLWLGGTNVFYNEKGYAGLSQEAIWYIGGLLKHAGSILAFAAPSTNSYRRLVPGYEAPINLIYSQRNRSACIRIPMYSKSPKAKRIEFRAPDPSCNPYLAFSAMLMAGLDGIENRIVPPDPIDRDLYEMEPEERHGIKMTPGSLAESLDELERDHDYLLKGGVFTDDLIREYIAYKRVNEVDAIALRPHPYEFSLYYDC